MDGLEIRFFVHGEPQGSATIKGKFDPGQQPYCIGANPRRLPENGSHFFGVIDEVRFSKSARYMSNFVPPARFQPDKDTLALYHFDEGQGDVLTDSSGNNQHGKIVNAKWVPGIARLSPSK